MPWHIGKSASARDIVIEPLSHCLQIEVRPWPEGSVAVPAQLDTDHVVFWQVEPPKSWLAAFPGRIIWAPMFDAVGARPVEWWRKFPSDLRIIAFSKEIARPAGAAGLKVFSCQYFADPSCCPEATWEGERVAFYWNRRGLYEAGFLKGFCAAAGVDRLLYRDETDPVVSKVECGCPLPKRLGKTVVEVIPWSESREAYGAQLNRAQIYLAPRSVEGVGVAFLEAMARGCVVVAYDGPTMSEYIQSGRNGLLVPNFGGCWPQRLGIRLKRRLVSELARLRRKPAPAWRLVSESQDWTGLGRMDYRAMGRRAREDHAAGFRGWQKSIELLAGFICPR